MSDWIECRVCDSEFKVVSLVSQSDIEYCPFCGSEIEIEDEDEDEDDEE